MTTTTALSPRDVLALADAIKAINTGAKITWVDNGKPSHKVRTGTLRHLSPADGDANHAMWGTDVRDMWVRITLVSGFDTWLPLPTLADLMNSGMARTD